MLVYSFNTNMYLCLVLIFSVFLYIFIHCLQSLTLRLFLNV